MTADDKNAETEQGRSEKLVAIDYAPTPAMRDHEQVAIYAGKDAYLVAMTGPASDPASHDRASRLVNDSDFRRMVNNAVPEAQDLIGKGTHNEYQGGSSAYPERMAALARGGAADRTEVVIYGDADREKVLALAMAESESIQNSLAPAPHDRARQLNADFRGMSQDERLQDTRTNSAAKQIAAMDAMIDRKYGHGTPEADRMKDAAREAVAQTLESGKDIRAPRLRSAEKDVELRRDDRQRTADAADRTVKDLER
ncbi:MAG: hypothetical protein ABT11_15260 [Novosphingobium sp. SCN 66-18]|nr:MAG: hypothetical protein ABT11_15260 [Novosphingobium sp. SCN 66-18]